VSRRSLARAALALAALVMHTPRAAADEAVDVAAPPSLVRLNIAAPDAVIDALAARLATRLGQRGAILQVHAVPRVDPEEAVNAPVLAGADTALARVWMDARSPNELTLYLVPASADRVLARRIALPSGVDEVALAETVFIIDGATQALQASRPIGVPRDEARAALQASKVVVPVVRQAPRSRVFAFQLGVAGGLRAWSDEALAVPEGALQVLFERRSGGLHLGLAFDGALRRDVQTETEDARITSGITALHLWLTLARSLGDTGVVRFMMGPGATVSEVDTQTRPGAQRLVVNGSRSDLEWSLGALLRGELTLAERLVLFVAAGADVVPIGVRYTAEVDGATSVVLAPWPVRPTALIGVAIDLPVR
jgi:hypothetical protein